MTILFDSFYSKGSGVTHTYCQDYAWHNEALAFGALSDGCSDAPDSDVAARILVHAACQAHLQYLVGEDPYNFHRVLKTRFNEIFFEQLRLSERQSFATLLALGMTPDMRAWVCVVVGDGVVVAKHRETQDLHVHIFDQEGANAPYYLSYQMNLKQDLVYTDFCEKRDVKHVLVDYWIKADGTVTKEQEEVLELKQFQTLHFDVETYDTVCCFTDGVRTFHNDVDLPFAPFNIRERLEFDSVLPQIMGFKNLVGTFTERRYKAFTKANPLLRHSDDFAIVASAEVP